MISERAQAAEAAATFGNESFSQGQRKPMGFR